MIVLPVGLGLGLTLGSSDDPIESEPTSSPTAPLFSPEELELREQLVQFSSTNTEVWDDPESPQNMAVRWLVNVDTQWQDQNVERLHQRFALAVFYYSTRGDSSWTDSFKFLTDAHECTWNDDISSKESIGVVCNDDDQVTAIDIGKYNIHLRYTICWGFQSHVSYFFYLPSK